MGDPKFSRKKWAGPSHPWEGARIAKENELRIKYGLKNKRELWKVQSTLGNFREQSRNLLARSRAGDRQAEKEVRLLLERLSRLGMLQDGAGLSDVLALDVEAILARRLQTVAYIKGLANTPKQARQFITHGHISIGDRKVTIPGYLVRRTEEAEVMYNKRSPLENELHPARPRDEEFPAPPPPAEAPAEEKPAEAPAEKKEEKPAGAPAEKKEEMPDELPDEAGEAEAEDELFVSEKKADTSSSIGTKGGHGYNP